MGYGYFPATNKLENPRSQPPRHRDACAIVTIYVKKNSILSADLAELNFLFFALQAAC
jgi:hypothetical protein